MWRSFGVLLAVASLCLSACVDTLDGGGTNYTEEKAFAANDPNPPAKEGGEEAPSKNGNTDSGTTSEESASPASSNSGPVDLGSVSWLHTNVSGWSETATLRSVSIRGGAITLNYNKANSWPGVSHAGASVNANPWIFVNRGGRWYGATWEWLRKGQTTKAVGAVHGSHIKKSPLSNFVPKSGETYGFMVSGLARDKTRNVQERSNVVMLRWP